MPHASHMLLWPKYNAINESKSYLSCNAGLFFSLDITAPNLDSGHTLEYYQRHGGSVGCPFHSHYRLTKRPGWKSSRQETSFFFPPLSLCLCSFIMKD